MPRYTYTLPDRDEGQLDAELKALGVPGYLALYGSGDKVQVEYDHELTPAEKSQVDALVAAHVPSAAEAAERLRAHAKNILDNLRDPVYKLIRAVALITMDEINILRQNPTSVLPPRTAEQLKTAIRNRIDGGEAD